MYYDDNADKVKGVERQLRSMASSEALDPEDLELVFARLRKALDEAEVEAVGNLRGRGVSWARIARVLGVSRQAATKRFSVGAYGA